ncbi:hypothetical protein D3C81_1183320 [compost metagenome]
MPRSGTKRARSVPHARAAFYKGIPCQQVNIGIQDKGKEQTGAADRADLRKPVSRPLPAKHGAQAALYRAGELQEIRVSVSDDIGRHRQRQDQRPFKEFFAGEVKDSDQPGSAYSQHCSENRNDNCQQQAVAYVFR